MIHPWKNLAEAYGRASRGEKVAVWLVLLCLLPILYFVLNWLSADFDTSGTAYVMMHLVDRAVHGQPIYAPSASDHVNGGYTPLYIWISAAVCKVFGTSFFWPRLVSLLSALGLSLLIGALVWQNTEGNLLLSVWAPAVLLWTTVIAGFNTWVVDVNVNGLHAALVVLGFYLLRPPRSVPRIAAAAMAIALSVLAKQTGLAYIAAGTVLLAGSSRKEAAIFAAVACVLVGGVFWWLNDSTGGEFFRQTITANRGPPWLVQRLVDEVILRVLMGLAGFLTAMTLIGLLQYEEGGFWKSIWKAEWFLCAAGVGVACIAHPKFGSGPTQDLVALAGLAVCGSIGLYRLSKRVPPWLGPRLLLAIPAAQLALVIVPGASFYPMAILDEHDYATHRQIASVFQSGRTSMYTIPYIQRAFGQEPGGYQQGDIDLWKDGRMDVSRKPDALVRPYRDQQFDYVILPAYASREDTAVRAILDHYDGIGSIPGHPRGPSGGNTRFDLFVFKAKRLQGR